MSTKQENDKLSPNLPSNVTPFPYPYYPAATEDDTIDLVELILTIWRYWWLIPTLPPGCQGLLSSSTLPQQRIERAANRIAILKLIR